MSDHELFVRQLLDTVERITATGDTQSVASLLAMTADHPQPLYSSLAESFARMMVKLEAREFHLQFTIENLQQFKEKLELANYDPLTGLPADRGGCRCAWQPRLLFFWH